MVYEIRNMNAFCKSIGKTVAREAGFSQKQLKKSIKVSNIKQMVRGYATESLDGTFHIDDQRTSQVCDEVLDWLIGVDLAEQAGNDDLDCYWDSDQDCMVFVTKEV